MYSAAFLASVSARSSSSQAELVKMELKIKKKIKTDAPVVLYLSQTNTPSALSGGWKGCLAYGGSRTKDLDPGNT